MKRILGTVTGLALIVTFLAGGALADRKGELVQTFDRKDRIDINTVSGDCVVRHGETDKITLELTHSYYPRDSFEPRIRESKNTLHLSERMHGSNSGRSTWVLEVPDGVEIDFNTASGDLEVSNVTVEVTVSTASGDIRLENCEGVFEIATASGDMDVENCKGEFQLSAASGDISARDVILTEEGSFSTASGRVRVQLGATSEYDMHVGSASGTASLDYAGHPVKGYFEMIAKQRGGRIKSTFDFDEEDTFRQHGDRYVRKSFTKESDDPRITIRTASGKAILEEG